MAVHLRNIAVQKLYCSVVCSVGSETIFTYLNLFGTNDISRFVKSEKDYFIEPRLLADYLWGILLSYTEVTPLADSSPGPYDHLEICMQRP